MDESGGHCALPSKAPRGSPAARSSALMSTRDTAATTPRTHTVSSSPARSAACSAPSSTNCAAAPPSSPCYMAPAHNPFPRSNWLLNGRLYNLTKKGTVSPVEAVPKCETVRVRGNIDCSVILNITVGTLQTSFAGPRRLGCAVVRRSAHKRAWAFSLRRPTGACSMGTFAQYRNSICTYRTVWMAGLDETRTPSRCMGLLIAGFALGREGNRDADIANVCSCLPNRRHAGERAGVSR